MLVARHPVLCCVVLHPLSLTISSTAPNRPLLRPGVAQVPSDVASWRGSCPPVGAGHTCTLPACVPTLAAPPSRLLPGDAGERAASFSGRLDAELGLRLLPRALGRAAVSHSVPLLCYLLDEAHLRSAQKQPWCSNATVPYQNTALLLIQLPTSTPGMAVEESPEIQTVPACERPGWSSRPRGVTQWVGDFAVSVTLFQINVQVFKNAC